MGVTGHTDLGNDGDVTRLGVSNNGFNLLLSVEALMWHARTLGAIPSADLSVRTFATNGCELGVFFDLNTPPLIIR